MVPRLYALAYALSIATSGNASKILLAGFDGFGPYDRRTKTIDELISLYVSCLSVPRSQFLITSIFISSLSILFSSST